MSEACEWNPVTDDYARTDDEPHGDATLSVGAGMLNLHLCERCASLPRFDRRKKTPLRQREKESA